MLLMIVVLNQKDIVELAAYVEQRDIYLFMVIHYIRKMIQALVVIRKII